MKTPVYMDYHATTPVDPRVLEAMGPYLGPSFGNPASAAHAYGWEAEKAVKASRAAVAAFLGAGPDEIIFTAGATEANNLALKGVWELYGGPGKHIVTQPTEHKSVLAVCRWLEKKGARVTWLPVNEEGLVRPEDVEKSLTEDTVFVSVMYANNEIGTVQPVREIGRIAKRKGVFFHVDGTQAAGRLPLNMEEDGIDLFSFSSHKMYGPKGVGALYVRRKNPRVRLEPLLHGGEQEGGLRSGTLNVPGIAGFAEACRIAAASLEEENARVACLRDRLWAEFEKNLPGIRLNGSRSQRLPGNLNVSFSGADAESLLLSLGGDVAVSSSSACTSGNTEPSHVLKAIALPRPWLHSAIRFGLGRFTTEEEVDFAAEKVVAAVRRLRETSPVYGGEETPRTGTES